jgi:hypothetical protein
MTLARPADRVGDGAALHSRNDQEEPSPSTAQMIPEGIAENCTAVVTSRPSNQRLGTNIAVKFGSDLLKRETHDRHSKAFIFAG